MEKVKDVPMVLKNPVATKKGKTLSILKSSPVKKQQRVQFDLNEQRLAELEKLMVMGGVGNRKELFNNALTLLEWAMKERSEGRSIASVSTDSDSYRELEMPILMNAGKHPA